MQYNKLVLAKSDVCGYTLIVPTYGKQNHSFKSHFTDFVEKRIGGMISYSTLLVG